VFFVIILQLLNQMCPTSLKVTKQQLELGSKMTLKECLKMEFTIASQVSSSYNFKEGIRALLIDRDGNPQWNPKKISEVSKANIESIFKPLDENDELKF
jgi:3-hydroxyisobutyryl-CoA hydrolase